MWLEKNRIFGQMTNFWKKAFFGEKYNFILFIIPGKKVFFSKEIIWRKKLLW